MTGSSPGLAHVTFMAFHFSPGARLISDQSLQYSPILCDLSWVLNVGFLTFQSLGFFICGVTTVAAPALQGFCEGSMKRNITSLDTAQGHPGVSCALAGTLFLFCICYSLAVWHWANYLLSLGHSFPFVKMVLGKCPPHDIALRIMRENPHRGLHTSLT